MFAQALTEIVRRLDEARINHLLDQYALIGGFAVAAWGVPRATHDLGLLLLSALPTLRRCLAFSTPGSSPVRMTIHCAVCFRRP